MMDHLVVRIRLIYNYINKLRNFFLQAEFNITLGLLKQHKEVLKNCEKKWLVAN